MIRKLENKIKQAKRRYNGMESLEPKRTNPSQSANQTGRRCLCCGGLESQITH